VGRRGRIPELELRVGWEEALVVGGPSEGFLAAGLGTVSRVLSRIESSVLTGSNVGLWAVVIVLTQVGVMVC
jgi:hypothetical protein